MAETDSEIKEEYGRALRIAQDAVKFTEIPHIASRTGPPSDFGSVLYFEEIENDVLLHVDFETTTTKGYYCSSLALVAWEILCELKRLFASSEALEFFCIDSEEVEVAEYNYSLGITVEYLTYLPGYCYFSPTVAIHDAIISYIKKSVEPELNDHLLENTNRSKQRLLPNDSLRDISRHFNKIEFELIPHLHSEVEKFAELRKILKKNRQAFFASEIELLEQHKLRTGLYKSARKRFKIERTQFFDSFRSATLEGWKQHWRSICENEFPDLSLAVYVGEYMPHVLSKQDLAKRYGYVPEYIDKILAVARRPNGKRSN